MMTILAFTESGLVWALPKAQHVALEGLALMNPVELKKIVTDKGEEIFSILPVAHTLSGLPMTLDNSLPSGTIELRLGDQVLYRIENLAVPCGME